MINFYAEQRKILFFSLLNDVVKLVTGLPVQTGYPVFATGLKAYPDTRHHVNVYNTQYKCIKQ